MNLFGSFISLSESLSIKLNEQEFFNHFYNLFLPYSIYSKEELHQHHDSLLNTTKERQDNEPCSQYDNGDYQGNNTKVEVLLSKVIVGALHLYCWKLLQLRVHCTIGVIEDIK